MNDRTKQTFKTQALESNRAIPIYINDLNSKEQLKEKLNLERFNGMMEEAAVRQYLCDNPDFFVKQPDLLSHIELANSGDDVPSLIERQIKTLQKKNQSMQTQLVEMLQSAFRNEDLLHNCNQFMLNLLNEKDFEGLINQILISLKTEFSLDASALILVGNHEACHPAKVYERVEDIKEILKNQFPENSPLCGRLEDSVKKSLFGDLAVELNSSALIPLGENCKFGLLALASKDKFRFAPEMGTLFIELIAKTVIGMVKQYQH